MRIDFSEPEYSNCFHYRTSDNILNTHQEPEPSNVIAASSVSVTPVSSEPVQTLGHDGSASTSISFEPAQSLGPKAPIQATPSSACTYGTTPALQDLGSTNFDFAGPKPPTTGSIEAPVQPTRSFSFRRPQDFGKTASSPSAFGNGVDFTVFGTTPVSVSSVCNPTAAKNPFGVSPLQRNSNGSSLGFGVERTLPQPSSYGASSINPNIGGSSYQGRSYSPGFVGYRPESFHVTTGVPAFYDKGRMYIGYAPGSRHIGYAPTPDVEDASKQIKSISASFSYRMKSHEELRWEDYKQGDKGSRPKATGFATKLFSSSSSSPFSTSLSVQRPHETVVGSSPASGCCTACGAATTTTTSSTSGFSTSNGAATTPPSSAATSLSGLFSTSGSSSADMLGTTNLAAQGTNLASQGTTTPTFEAYPTTSHRDDLLLLLSIILLLLVCCLLSLV